MTKVAPVVADCTPTVFCLIDFSSTGNIGQDVGLVRVGESFLMNFGFNYDASRDNYGFQFGLEPRFLPSSRLGLVGGVQVPPAGVMGLE